MKPPIVNFTPFHPSRVEPLRGWREKDLREIPPKGKRIIFDKVPGAKRAKKPKVVATPGGLFSTLDSANQAMVLAVMAKLRGK